MSWQAQTAVSERSRIEDFDLFRLLLHLAGRATAAGVVDPAPTIETLAARFDCSEKTIRNRIKRLINAGELERTRQGRKGSSSAYRITLDLPPALPAEEVQPVTMPPTLPAEVAQLVKNGDMLPVIEYLYRIIAEAPQFQPVKRGGFLPAEGDYRKRPEGSDTDDPNNIYIYNNGHDPEEMAQMIKALNTAAREVYTAGVNDDKFKAAAAALIDDDQILIEDVEAFPLWWDRNGQYQGKPALNSVLSNIGNVADNRIKLKEYEGVIKR